MEKSTLQAQIRQELGRKTRQLRRQQRIPAVLYGKGIKNLNLTLEIKDVQDLLKKFGANALINLEIDQCKPVLVFLQHIQRDPISNQIIHCDLWKIDPKKEIKTEVPIKAEGEAPAVEELEGILLQNKKRLNISALPEDLIAEVRVDISGLKSFEDKIQIKDILVSDKIKILDNPEEIVFSIQEPRSKEEMEELEEKPEEDVEGVEIEKKEKEEKEEKPEEAQPSPDEKNQSEPDQKTEPKR
jgi:large subunit ribosomal protein L25